MPAATAPFLAACALLALGGVAKLLAPGDLVRALRAAGIPARGGAVRVVALGELALAVVAVAVPGPVPAALVATSYAGFAVFVAAALARGWPIASCGCVGRADTPPSAAHLLIDLAAVGAAAWWAAVVPGGPGAAYGAGAGADAALAVVTVALTFLAYLALTDPRRPLRQGTGRAGSAQP